MVSCDLAAQQLDAALDVRLLAGAVDDGGVLLVDGHPARASEISKRELIELLAELFRDHLAAGEHGEILQHLLAAIAEARRLHGRDLQSPAQLVDDEGRERLTLDLLGDDDDRLPRARDLLEHRNHLLHVGDLLLADQDVRIFELGHLPRRIGDEVGRDEAAIELHSFDHFQRRLEALRLLDGDDAFLADLLHRLGDDGPDRLVAVGGDGADLRDLGLALRLDGELLQLADDRLDRRVDAALERHRIVPGRDQPLPFGIDRRGKNRRGGGSVAGDVGGLGGDLADHLRAHVLEAIAEVDLLGDGHAVLGNRRRAERLLDDDVAALRAEGHRDRVRQRLHSAQDLLARGLLVEGDLLGCHEFLLKV